MNDEIMSPTPADTSPVELRVRVSTLERDIGHIEKRVVDIGDSMATKNDIASIMSRIEAVANAQSVRIEALAAQQSLSAKPNYSLVVSVVAVVVLALSTIGGLAYGPLSSNVAKIEMTLSTLGDKVVPQKQYDADQTLARAERQALRADLNVTVQQQRYNLDTVRLQEDMKELMPRREYEAQHQDDDRRFSAMAQRMNRLEDLGLRKP